MGWWTTINGDGGGRVGSRLNVEGFITSPRERVVMEDLVAQARGGLQWWVGFTVAQVSQEKGERMMVGWVRSRLGLAIEG